MKSKNTKNNENIVKSSMFCVVCRFLKRSRKRVFLFKRIFLAEKKIFKDFAFGKYTTYKQIKDSKEANLLINPKSGNKYRFKDDTIKKLLTNKLYMGKIELKKWGITEQKAIHEAIIDESTFRKVQIMLEKKGKKKHSNISPEEFPLKGDLLCSQCKSTLVYSKSTGRTKKYPFYRCNTSRKSCDIKPKSIQTKVIHKQFSKLLEETAIKPQVLKLADKVLEDVYKTKSDQLMGVQQTQEATIKNLTEKRNKFITFIWLKYYYQESF